MGVENNEEGKPLFPRKTSTRQMQMPADPLTLVRKGHGVLEHRPLAPAVLAAQRGVEARACVVRGYTYLKNKCGAAAWEDKNDDGGRPRAPPKNIPHQHTDRQAQKNRKG